MRQKIKEVLGSILGRIGARDIPPLTPVPSFPFAEEHEWCMPDGDFVMSARHQLNRKAFRQENLFAGVFPGNQSTILSLPLIERATEWGIKVLAVPGNDTFYGCYGLSEPRQILLASPEPIIYFHELGHAAHEKIVRWLLPSQTPRQEIVAGLCAQLISEIVEEGNFRFLGNTFRLIARHSFKLNVSPLAGCHLFLPEIHHATRLILTGDDT